MFILLRCIRRKINIFTVFYCLLGGCDGVGFVVKVKYGVRSAKFIWAPVYSFTVLIC